MDFFEGQPLILPPLTRMTGVTWLEQETKTLDIRGQQVTLAGIACSHDLRAWFAMTLSL